MSMRSMKREEFFESQPALSFDDFCLQTLYTNIQPDQVDLRTRFSRNFPLIIPAVSAAMDTVTGLRLAVSMSQNGGAGVVPRSFSPVEQAEIVRKVRTTVNGLISDPALALDTETIAQIKRRQAELKSREGVEFHSFPVINASRKLVSVLTREDFYFCMNDELMVGAIMKPGHIQAPEGTSIKEAYETMLKYNIKALPLVNEAGELAGMYAFSDVSRLCLGKEHMLNIDEAGQLRVAAAVGVITVGDDTMDRVERLVHEHVTAVVIDTAHAHTESVLMTLRTVKAAYPDLDVVVGNISSIDAAIALADAGADGIKVGQGVGAACTTSVVTKCGCPQGTAIARSICAQGSQYPDYRRWRHSSFR
jgi:IMP dehydrogenase